MNHALTTEQRSLSRKYLTYEFLGSFFCVAAIWLYFYRLFINDQQIGIMDGLAFAIGLLAEVPSGALADKFGRDKIVRLGQILTGAGFLIQAFGTNFTVFLVGQSVMMIGVSFTSGAAEALFFDKLKFDPESSQWRKLVTRGSQVAIISGFIATIVGGALYSVDPRIPWILNGLALIGSVFVIWTIKEDRVQKTALRFTAEVKEYLVSIKNGFAQFRAPGLVLYVPFIFIVQGLFYTIGWGLLRLVLLDRFHFDPFWGSVVITVSGIITVGILSVIHKHADRLKEKDMFTLVALSAAASLILSMANVGIWGGVIILVLYAIDLMLHPFMSEALNHQTEEGQRATVLSVASFMRTAPYVLLAPLIGYLNANDRLEFFLIGWALLIIAALLIYLAYKKEDGKREHVELEIEPRIPHIPTQHK